MEYTKLEDGNYGLNDAESLTENELKLQDILERLLMGRLKELYLNI
ncbi:MAG: hypothetical protein ACLS9A_08685 [Clostridia bacterium]